MQSVKCSSMKEDMVGNPLEKRGRQSAIPSY